MRMYAIMGAMECSCDLDRRLDGDLFRVLADPRRLEILSRVAHCCGEPRSVGDIAADLDLDQSGVSRHLAALRDGGALVSERAGRSVRYRVRYTALAELLRGLADAIEGCETGCCDASCGQEQALTTSEGGGER